MKSSRPLLILLSVISLTAIVVGAITFINRAALEHVYAYNCGIIDYKPESLTPICGDAHEGVANIEWDTWSSTGATGVGSYGINLCKPTCANDTWKFADVNLTLSKVIDSKGKKILTHIEIISQDKKNLPKKSSAKYEWDLNSGVTTLAK